MNVFRSLQLAASAPVARERLQILLEYERKLGSQIDLFEVLREEILAVISRHIVEPEKVQVRVDRGAKFSTLGVNVEIPNPSGKARTLPTDCAVLQPDKTVGTRGLRVKGQMMQRVDAVAGTLALPIGLVGGTVGAIVTVALGGWLYVQQRDIGKRRALDDRETALMAGFEEHVIAPRPAGGVVAETGPLVALRGTSGPGTVVSLPGDPAAAEPASQAAAVTPPAALESAMSPPQELSPLRDPAAPEPASQAATVTPPAALGPRSKFAGQKALGDSGFGYRRVRRSPRFQGPPFDRPLVTAFEERHRQVSAAQQRLAGMASHQAGAAGDQDGLHRCASQEVRHEVTWPS
jgi:cell division topological specificity factor